MSHIHSAAPTEYCKEVSWISEIWQLFKRDRTSEFKAIVTERKSLSDEYRDRMKSAEEKIEKLAATLADIEEHERECHRMLIRANTELRDAREELIFLRKMKSP